MIQRQERECPSVVLSACAWSSNILYVHGTYKDVLELGLNFVSTPQAGETEELRGRVNKRFEAPKHEFYLEYSQSRKQKTYSS